MAEINKFARLISGVTRNVDMSTNTMVVGDVKIGGGAGTVLTKAILDNLITLQDGSDAGALHNHDGAYFTETELGSSTSSSGSDLIGDDNTYSNFTPAAATVKGALAGIDTAIASAGGSVFDDATFRIEDADGDSLGAKFDVSAVTTADKTITMPDSNVDLGDIITNTSALTGKADTDLGNLGTTAINANLVPDSTGNARNMGLPTQHWNQHFLKNSLFYASGVQRGLIDAQSSPNTSGPSGEAFDFLLFHRKNTNGAKMSIHSEGQTSGANITTGINVETGNESGTATGGSGDIKLRTGTVVSGTRGKISLNALEVDVNSSKIVNVTDPTAAQDAATMNYVDTGLALKADDADVIKKDGSVAFTGDQAMGGFKITGMADGVAATDAATKGQIDASAAGMLPKAPVDLATTGNITLSGEQTIDGTLTSATRILVQEQSTLAENGIYVTAAGAWSRATDADGSPANEIQGGNSVFVNNGTVNGSTVFRLAGSGNITVDVGDQDWIVYSRAEAITASTGLTQVGLDVRLDTSSAGAGLGFAAGVLSTNVDDSSIEVNADTLRVKASGVTDAMLASDYIQTTEVDNASIEFAGSTLNVKALGVTDGMLAGSISTSKLTDAATVTEAKAFFDATDISGVEAESLTDGSSADALHNHATLSESMVVGETMPASGPVAVRMGIVPVAAETEGRVYKADPTELSVGGVDPFHVVGIAIAASQAVAGSMTVVKHGKLTATAHGFSLGLPIYLDSAGVLTSTAPSTAGEGTIKVGVAVSTNIIEVAIQIMGVN